ncbi:MAG: sodium:calcium antiporter [Nitrosopumilus sp. H8]|nr:MAG: sodium:calcium antiporter [Nitrosopumilus sp. H13]RNJ77523.1 MAG: sodium:calcium antiporter [Nitrosopumilus sp. H8]
MDTVLNVALTIAGLAMLCFGGNWLVGGGVSIAKRYRVSNLVIGMTIVAYGTSTPELAASIAAAGEHGAIILGNVVGSNIANVGMVIGISAVLVPLAAGASILRREILIMIGVSFLLVALSADGELSTYDGLLLLGGLGVFAAHTFRTALNSRNQTGDADEKRRGIPSSAAMIVVGVVLLYVGAILTVENAVALAEEFGLSEKIIGLTIIAIGTSLPELITSIIAIKKGHTDIGIGNIIGSNIYNILMILGLGAALGGVTTGADVYADYAIMIIFGLSLLVVVKTKVIGRTMGACLAAGYVAYLVSFLL